MNHSHPHPSSSHQCLLHFLLLSQPPLFLTNKNTSINPQEPQRKPFSPWKPGDAFSVEDDTSDWRLLLGSVREGEQIRYLYVLETRIKNILK